MTKAIGVNGKFVQPSVVYRWRSSFFTTSRSGQFSPLEMVAIQYFWVHISTDKLDICNSDATLTQHLATLSAYKMTYLQ